MAIINRHSSSSDGANAEYGSKEYGGKSEYETGVTGPVPILGTDGGVDYNDNSHLHRGLKSRHITMIAIGGAIGTGLIVGTGKALAQSG
jgi:amino acid transporter